MEKQLKVISSTKAPMNKNTVWLDPKQDSIKFFDNGKWQKIIGGASNSEEIQVIEWSHNHNMNDYKTAGTYRIKGERTGDPMDDNLPIMNSGSGHTIDGILYVLDSSLPTGGVSQDDKCVTQFLMLSNRAGGQEGDMYMRSGYGLYKSDDVFNWKPWEKYQTNMEVGFVSDEFEHSPTTGEPISNKGMNSLVDSGIYSGVYVPNVEGSEVVTFAMLVINGYAVASLKESPKIVTQIKYGLSNMGEFSVKNRKAVYDESNKIWNWSQWESVGGGAGQEIPKYYLDTNESTPIPTDVLNVLEQLPVGKECIFYSSGSQFVYSGYLDAWGMSIPEDWDGSTALGSVFEHFLGLCFLNGRVSHIAPIEFKFKKVLLHHLDGSNRDETKFIVDAFVTNLYDARVTAKYVVEPTTLIAQPPLSFSINQPKEFIQYWNSTSDAENYKTVPSTINEFIIYSGGSTLHHLCSDYAGDKYKITEGFYKDFNDNFCTSDSHEGTAIFKCKNIKAKRQNLTSGASPYIGNLIEVEATYLNEKKLPVSGAKYLVYSGLSKGLGGRTWNYYLTDNFVRTSEWTSQEQAAE